MKKYLLPLVSLIATALVSGSALATSMVYETRPIDPSVNTTDYRTSWQSQTSAITSNVISDFNGTRAGNESFAHLVINFDINGSNNGIWDFQIAPDAGYGGAIYLDGIRVDYKPEDLWWGGDRNNASEILNGSLSLASGSHVFEGFWAENCCNGDQGGRFSVNGGDWQSLTTANLNAANVPAPATFWLFAIGFAGLVFSRNNLTVKIKA
jgi:hypothetical protein